MIEWFTETTGKQRLIYGLIGIGVCLILFSDVDCCGFGYGRFLLCCCSRLRSASGAEPHL